MQIAINQDNKPNKSKRNKLNQVTNRTKIKHNNTDLTETSY